MNMLTPHDLENIRKNIAAFRVVPNESNLYYRLSYDNRPISYQKNYPESPDDIVIYLEPLSALPNLVTKVKINLKELEPFVSFVNKNEKALNCIGLSEVNSCDWLEHLRDNLFDKIILARPMLKENNGNNQYEPDETYFYNYQMEYISKEIPLHNFYYTVPSVVGNLDIHRFESMLEDRAKTIQFANYNGAMPCPKFIICDDYIYYTEGALEANEKNMSNFMCVNPEKIKKFKMSLDIRKKSHCTYKGLHFFDQVDYNKLIKTMEKDGEPLSKNLHLLGKIKESLKIKEEAINHGKLAMEEQAASIELNQQSQELFEGKEIFFEKSKKDECFIEEYQFLNKVQNTMINDNLYVEDCDIYNFHTAVKTNFLTIVAGISGTGKTRLVTEYAKALGLVKNENLLIIPISPAYTEPSDILGFLNPRTGTYMESETGLAKFLYNASKEPDRLFMIIFEEINLSQVEYWFSPFISLLELEGEYRELTLVHEKQYCLQEEYRKPVPIGKNVIMVGTANLDETTKELSNRLLDRANIIKLQKQSFLTAKNTIKEEVEVPKFTNITADTFESWVIEERNLLKKVMYDKELSLLDKIHEAINKVDPQNGVSFRVVNAIAKFILNIPKDENNNRLIKRQSAFDLQLCQRILTKVKGHREMLRDLLGEYDLATDEIKGGFLRQLLQEYTSNDEKSNDENLLSMFEHSEAVLRQKAKELVINGYTM